MSHYYSQDYTRWGSWIVYGGSEDGIYGYNLDTHAVAPVLLPPNSQDLRIV